MATKSTLRACALAPILLALSACGGSGKEGARKGEGRGVIVVSAPVAGEVRRVLVGEGAQIAEGASVVEIVVRTEPQAGARQVPEDPVARAAQAIQSSEAEIEAARAAVVRAEVEVQRLTPLVAAGQASQGELDGARGEYHRAQQRLQRAQGAAQSAQGGLVAARRQSQNLSAAGAAPKPSEQVVPARATSSGTVTVVSVKPGDRVTQGQPLATLRAGNR